VQVPVVQFDAPAKLLVSQAVLRVTGCAPAQVIVSALVAASMVPVPRVPPEAFLNVIVSEPVEIPATSTE
jgi:hypothetical protein